MRPHTINRPHRKNKRRWLASAFLFVIAHTASAQEATLQLIPQPAFMRPDYAIAIPGSKDTILTPARVQGEDVDFLKKADIERLKLSLDSVRRVTAANASEALKALKPQYIRDRKGVILYALLASDSPATASSVLAPDFVDKFTNTLGPDLLVAIPTRYRIYVYPALASRFQDTADQVLSDYEVSGYPASKEIFRVTAKGLQAIGTFDTR